GFRPHTSGCVPVFDECPATTEIPILGGGCRQVGVTECASGFDSDGEGGCAPILPAEPCPPGTMEVIGRTDCTPVGVTQCATGFESDGEGGCAPILPTEPCPPGTMEVLGLTECQPVGVLQCGQGFVSDGEGGCDPILPPDPCPDGSREALGTTACQPIGDCGTGTWGGITADATTVFVDSSFTGGVSDGTPAAPFITVGDALATVQQGGRVAIAAGIYPEFVTLDTSVVLVGRCAAMVTLVGSGVSEQEPTILVTPSGSQSRISGMTVTGTQGGIVVDAATQVEIGDLQVIDTGHHGIVALTGAAITVQRSVVARAMGYGISSEGSTTTIEESVIKEGVPLPDGTKGRGVGAFCGTTGDCGVLSINRSVVSTNRDSGVSVVGVEASLVESVIANTQSEIATGTSGRGVDGACHVVRDVCGNLAVRDSVVTGNRDRGVCLQGMDGTIDSSDIRDTQGRLLAGQFGTGITARCDVESGTCGRLEVHGSKISRNHTVGLTSSGVETTVESTLIVDTQPQQSDGLVGIGLSALCNLDLSVCPLLSITSCLVARNHMSGVFVGSGQTTIESTVVRETQPSTVPIQGVTYGTGISALCEEDQQSCGSLFVQSSIVDDNHLSGIEAVGGSLTIVSSIVRNTHPESGYGSIGFGIYSACDPFTYRCGQLFVSASLVSTSHIGGIAAVGTDAWIEQTVVEETISMEYLGSEEGYGISADCSQYVGRCSMLEVNHGLLRRNQRTGLVTAGADVSIARSFIRGTLPGGPGGDGGFGIDAYCSRWVDECGVLSVDTVSLEENHGIGLVIRGPDTQLNSVVVRDTTPRPSNGSGGSGIIAACDLLWTDYCGTIQVDRSLITDNLCK
ncbi:hypothetical protein ACFL51_00905, partial [Myxococcota bacterium]